MILFRIHLAMRGEDSRRSLGCKLSNANPRGFKRGRFQIRQRCSNGGNVSQDESFLIPCAWNATGSIPVLGPALGALSPASAAWASSNLGMAFNESLSGNQTHGLTQARVALVIGTLASCGLHAAIVDAMLSSMVGGFDMTVRKLAGTA